VFPEAEGFSEKHAKLTPEQAAGAEAELKGKLSAEDKKTSVYVAKNGGEGVLGNAVYFPAKDQDGDPAKGLVGVGADGKISKVVIFSHHKDYPVAQEAFLGQFAGKGPGPEEWKSVKPASGHEAASAAVIKAVRKAVAIAKASGFTPDSGAMMKEQKEEKEGSSHGQGHGDGHQHKH
jgi:hypothetical protein